MSFRNRIVWSWACVAAFCVLAFGRPTYGLLGLPMVALFIAVLILRSPLPSPEARMPAWVRPIDMVFSVSFVGLLLSFLLKEYEVGPEWLTTVCSWLLGLSAGPVLVWRLYDDFRILSGRVSIEPAAEAP